MNPGDGEGSGARSMCPQCGAVCEPYQEYCLDCGTRLFESKTIVGDLGEYWRHLLVPSRDRWIRPVLAALVVATIAAAVAVATTGGSGIRTIEALGPAVDTRTSETAPATVSESAETRPGTQNGTSTDNASSRANPPVQSRGLIAWPGSPAWTIVLASVPTSGGKAGAREKALEAQNAGLGDVGVLESSDYSSLHPGYYVVFSGIYKSQTTANKHLPAVRRAGFDAPYVKRVAS